MLQLIHQDTVFDFGAAISLASDVTSGLDGVKAIYVGGAGDIKVDLKNIADNSTSTVTFKAVPVGTVLKIAPKKIYSSANGTTATNLVQLG